MENKKTHEVVCNGCGKLVKYDTTKRGKIILEFGEGDDIAIETTLCSDCYENLVKKFDNFLEEVFYG